MYGASPQAPFGAPIFVPPPRVKRSPLHWVAVVLLLLAFVAVPAGIVVGGVLGAQADRHNDTPDSAFGWGIVAGVLYGALAFIVLTVLAAAFSAGASAQQRNRNRERPDLRPRPAVTATLVISVGLVVAMASLVVFTLLANIGN